MAWRVTSLLPKTTKSKFGILEHYNVTIRKNSNAIPKFSNTIPKIRTLCCFFARVEGHKRAAMNNSGFGALPAPPTLKVPVASMAPVREVSGRQEGTSLIGQTLRHSERAEALTRLI